MAEHQEPDLPNGRGSTGQLVHRTIPHELNRREPQNVNPSRNRKGEWVLHWACGGFSISATPTDEPVTCSRCKRVGYG